MPNVRTEIWRLMPVIMDMSELKTRWMIDKFGVLWYLQKTTDGVFHFYTDFGHYDMVLHDYMVDQRSPFRAYVNFGGGEDA